jgi:SAM-dependent methyltransferase
MKRDYWESLADNYEAEIFEVSKEDRNGTVLSALDKYAKPNATASDIGCGIGHFLPALSARFNKVVAIDLSAKCIARAQAAHPNLPNISYMAMDLFKPNARLPKADFAFSCNSILTASLKHRNHMLDVVCKHLRPKGHLILVVPSLESTLLKNARLIEWNLKDGAAPGSAARTGFKKNRHDLERRIHEGIVQIDGVETKHYLGEELTILMKDRNMMPIDIQKIEYSWKTEFATPPRWMKDPFPWDWLCIAQKVP